MLVMIRKIILFLLKKNNITPIVLYNKRKPINQKIINEHLFTNHQTEIYKKKNSCRNFTCMA
jgi:hypothetical protein